MRFAILGDVLHLALDLRRLARAAFKNRVGENAQRHRFHAPDLVAEPAKKYAAGGGTHQEYRDDSAEP